MPQWSKIAHICVSDGVPKRSLLVALVVGTVLNLINQGDALIGHGHFDPVKAVLTFAVPYCVATYGAVSYRLKLDARDAVAAAVPNGISRSAESIHQEVILKAEAARVYEALTDAGKFQQVMLLSEAVKSGMVKLTMPAEISRETGGAFTLFGGHISGRHIELIPNERIVQAWRAGDWGSGIYSIARFELAKHGRGTRLVFDHTGFPVGKAEHLAAGWKGNYWEPLEKFFA